MDQTWPLWPSFYVHLTCFGIQWLVKRRWCALRMGQVYTNMWVDFVCFMQYLVPTSLYRSNRSESFLDWVEHPSMFSIVVHIYIYFWCLHDITSKYIADQLSTFEDDHLSHANLQRPSFAEPFGFFRWHRLLVSLGWLKQKLQLRSRGLLALGLLALGIGQWVVLAHQDLPPNL